MGGDWKYRPTQVDRLTKPRWVMGFVAVAAVISTLVAWPFMWMWNYSIAPTIDGVRPIAYWPAYCLMWFISLFLLNGNTSK